MFFYLEAILNTPSSMPQNTLFEQPFPGAIEESFLISKHQSPIIQALLGGDPNWVKFLK